MKFKKLCTYIAGLLTACLPLAGALAADLPAVDDPDVMDPASSPSVCFLFP
jgi:hypothetical protein